MSAVEVNNNGLSADNLLIPQVYQEIFRDNYRYFILSSGRISGKTSLLVAIWWVTINKQPDRDIVVSKYVLGYILLAASAAVSYIGSLAAAAFMRETVSAELFSQLILICAIGIILMSVNMPLMFKMGVEKARLLFIISVGFVIAAVSFSQRVYESAEVSNVEIGSISLPLFFAAVAVSLVSMVISVSIYKRKEH